jgi:hypothetical protein
MRAVNAAIWLTAGLIYWSLRPSATWDAVFGPATAMELSCLAGFGLLALVYVLLGGYRQNGGSPLPMTLGHAAVTLVAAILATFSPDQGWAAAFAADTLGFAQIREMPDAAARFLSLIAWALSGIILITQIKFKITHRHPYSNLYSAYYHGDDSHAVLSRGHRPIGTPQQPLWDHQSHQHRK